MNVLDPSSEWCNSTIVRWYAYEF